MAVRHSEEGLSLPRVRSVHDASHFFEKKKKKKKPPQVLFILVEPAFSCTSSFSCFLGDLEIMWALTDWIGIVFVGSKNDIRCRSTGCD